MDKNCKNCTFRERSYGEYPCDKCRNGSNWTPSDDLLEFAIAELEKIKEKVKQRKILPKTSARSDYEMGLIDGRSTEKVAIMGIIGKEIAKLKGE